MALGEAHAVDPGPATGPAGPIAWHKYRPATAVSIIDPQSEQVTISLDHQPYPSALPVVRISYAWGRQAPLYGEGATATMTDLAERARGRRLVLPGHFAGPVMVEGVEPIGDGWFS
ncbi:MAG: hypothetical protein V7605_1226 [Acidimicrobiaceae bacterium]|jgi:hypothetical protein